MRLFRPPRSWIAWALILLGLVSTPIIAADMLLSDSIGPRSTAPLNGTTSIQERERISVPDVPLPLQNIIGNLGRKSDELQCMIAHMHKLESDLGADRSRRGLYATIYDQRLQLVDAIATADASAVARQHRALGMAMFAIGHNALAKAHLRAAGDIDSDDVSVQDLYVLALIDMTSGRMDAALSKLDKSYAIAHRRGDYDAAGHAAYMRSNVIFALGRFEDAKAALKKAVDAYQHAGNRVEAEEAEQLRSMIGMMDLIYRNMMIDHELNANASVQTGASIPMPLGAPANMGPWVKAFRPLINVLITPLLEQIKTRLDQAPMPQIRAVMHSFLGQLYSYEGDDAAAESHLRKAFILHAQLDYLEGQVWTLQVLAEVLRQQGKVDSAILADKLVINRTQQVRRSADDLGEAKAQSYIRPRDIIYRSLFEQLADQKRLLEAEQVLAMRKQRELYAHLDAPDASNPSALMLFMQPAEQRFMDKLDRAQARVSRARAALLAVPFDANGNPAEDWDSREQERKDAESALDKVVSLLPGWFDAETTQRPITSLHSADTGDLARSAHLRYLVADLRLHLLLTTPTGMIHRLQRITSGQLDAAIAALRRAVQSPQSNPLPAAQALYQLLIAPVRRDLELAAIDELAISPDGRLRYVPFAALHDGDGWLIQRWPVRIQLTDNQRRAHQEPASARAALRVEGFGSSAAVPPFPALPCVRDELDGIVRQDAEDTDGVLSGQLWLDRAFTSDVLLHSAAADADILHIASHFALRPDAPADSGLVLGNGKRLSLATLLRAKLNLRHIRLVTLSACNTAISGLDGNGVEIDALARVMRRQGAGAVLASLWSVGDPSTAVLMQRFYRHWVGDGEVTLARALRNAQLDVRAMPPVSDCRSLRGFFVEPNASVKANGAWSHPFYWAAFVLYDDRAPPQPASRRPITILRSGPT